MGISKTLGQCDFGGIHLKAIVYQRYGSPEVLELKEVEKPLPSGNEVLIKIYAAAVTRADSMMRSGRPFIGRLVLGLTKPKKAIPGTEFAGEIEAVGKDVSLFKKGDRVFGSSDISFGAHAEYISLPETAGLAIKPENLDYAETVSVFEGALTALPFLRDKGEIKKGQKVLIIGASGAVGTAAVQLARYFGAEVTGVCSAANFDMVKSLGAQNVIDYTQEDFTQNGQPYNIIFDTVGKSSFARSKNSLTQNGIYLSTVLRMPILFQTLWTSKIGSKKAKFTATGLRPVKDKIEDLNFLKELAESGTIKPVIDRRYSLEQTPEAHMYVDKGHKRGNVIISIDI
jgi:NADPH:quinone reductase-like Zn-dependent oxidoreductase